MFDLMPRNRRGRDLFNYFDEMEKNLLGNAGWETNMSQIVTDIIDKGDHYLVQAELPGFKKEEIMIDIKDTYLTVRAEHIEQKEEKEESFVRKERRYGRFSRSFDISDVDAEKINAEFHEGVLELTLPKVEQRVQQTKHISIK